MKSTFKVLFYLKKGSEKKNGEVMIMARITIDGKLCQFSTKQSIQPDNWNTAAGKAKGRDAVKINFATKKKVSYEIDIQGSFLFEERF